MNFSPGALLTNNRTRILDVFEKWLNELDTIQHVDFQRATVCLHHIARLLEDAVLVPMNSSSLMNDDVDDERFEVLLSRVLLEDYSEVIYNAFRSMVTTADTNYQNACLRVVVILKLTSREIGDLFAEVLPMTELEDFVKEQINHPNELLRARVGFLLGEMLLEEKNLPDIPIETILQPRIPRIKELRLLLEEKSDELIEAMAHVHEIAKYTSNASIPIPEPDSPTPDASIWGVDECGTEGTALHYLTILNGLLHLTAALIEFSEALAIAVSESLLKECIEILKLPAVPVQTFCMILIGNALIHRKLAMDFIELDGPSEVYRLIDTYRHGPTKGDFETFSSHATFIISSIFKHSSAVDLYVKPTNAHQIVGFMFSLFNNWDSLGTNLNILEWCAEAIHHPLLLRVIHAANFWKKVKSICDSLIRMKTNPDRKADSMFFLEHFRSVTVLALKYIVAHMFWGYQYSKSLFSDMDDLKPLSKSFGTLIRKNYVGQAGTVDIVQALSSSPAVIKIDEAEMYALEAYVFKSLIRTGHLPKGMTLDLFGGDGYVSSTSQQFFASAMQTASSVHEATAAAAAATTATTTAAGAATAAATGNANTTSYDPLAAFNFQVEPIGYYSSSPSAAATTAAAAAAATSSADVDYDAQSVVSMVTKVLPEWTIVDAAIREGIVPALFHILMLENKDSTTVCMALLCLQLLCVDAAAIVEVMQYDLAKHFDAATIQNTSELAAFQYKKGLEVLLYSVASQERRDPSVMVSVLRLLAAMSAAPYFRYNGHDSSVAHSFFEDYLKSPYFAATQLPPHQHQHHPLAEKKKPLFDTAKKQISSKLAYNALENVQRSVRKAIRAHAGISILTQMLYYKKNVTFSIPIRLETLKILLGLQQDDDIRQILVKLRLPTVLENQIQAEKSQSNMYDMNTIPQKLHDRALLQFYTDNLVNLLRGVAIGGIGGAVGVGGGVGGGIDATGLSLLDDAQEHLLRKTVVDHSNIEFSQFELLYLIRDHLAAMGLTKSATTLEAELIEREQQANQRQKMYGSSSSSGTKPAASTTTDSHHKAGSHTSGSRLAAVTRQASIERRLSGIHLPEGPSAAVVDDAAVAEAEGETAPGSKKRLREVIETPAAAVDVTEDSATTAHASSSSVSSAKRLSVAFAAVATNAGPDGDGDDDPTSSPPPLKYSSSARKAATAAVAPLAGSALKRLPSSGTTATAAAAAAAAVQATPTAAAASVATATPGTRGGGGSTLAPLLPLAKSQRRKNIARALKADTCSYVLPAVVAPAKSALTTAMTPAMAPSAMSTSPRPSTMPSSSSSSSAAAVAGGSFVTPSVTRYPHYHHHHHHPHHHVHHSVTSATSTGAAAASTSTALSTSSTAAHQQSKLSAIMRRYLRLQHCQCKHPVSTLPVMSLLKPHVCPKPPPIQFYNINRIVHRYQPICGNAQWMRHYRHDVQAGQLHHLYASYRTVMTEEEDGYMVTACAFGQQPHRLWLGWYNYDNGAEVTMVDTSQQDTLGEAYDLDLPGMIDSFVFPDMHYSASAAFAQPQQPIMATMIQSHMITQGQTAGKEVYLYRDRDSAEVFQSPALHKLSITAEDIRQVMAASQPGYTVPTSTLVDDDLRCFESIAFSRETGRYLAASMVNDVLPMGAAFVFDVESGVVVHRLLNEASGGSGGGPMYAYPQVHYVPEEDQVLWFDGKLFDLRTNATLHRFDKLSQYGNAAFHPNGYDVIIDSAIWDLRMFALRQTVPLLENCRVQFDRFGGGLIAAMSMKDDDRPFASIREEYLGFHVLHPGDYSHIHTQNVVKAGQVSGYGLAEVQVDRHGGGLVAGILLAGAQEATMSQCKVLEIGLRKRTADDDGLDGEEDSDEDDDWHGSSDDDEDDDEEDEDEAGQDEMSVDDDSDEDSDEDDDEDDEGRGGRHGNDDDEGRRGENDEDDDDDEDDEDYEDIEGSAEEDDGDWETDSDDSGEDYETVSEDDDDDDEDGGDEEGDEDGDAGAGDGPRAGAPARPSRQAPTGGRGGAAFPRRAGGGGGGGGYSRR